MKRRISLLLIVVALMLMTADAAFRFAFNRAADLTHAKIEYDLSWTAHRIAERLAAGLENVGPLLQHHMLYQDIGVVIINAENGVVEDSDIKDAFVWDLPNDLQRKKGISPGGYAARGQQPITVSLPIRGNRHDNFNELLGVVVVGRYPPDIRGIKIPPGYRAIAVILFIVGIIGLLVARRGSASC